MTRVVYAFFFISGACGLIYEIVWSRIMAEIFGTTVLAIGTVLAAFMLGLAAGGYFLGKAGDRSSNPLRLYAYYELGIAVAALISLFLMDRVSGLYVWANGTFSGATWVIGLFRFLIAFLLVFVPTFLMGATLPILSRFVIRSTQSVGRSLASLYAINTLGAVAGCLLAGFVLIATLGVHNSVYVAVCANTIVGVLAFLLSRSNKLDALTEVVDGENAPVENERGDEGAGVAQLLLVFVGLSGLASFAYEIFWTRSLVFIIGNSTYALTLMLTAFLSGIALGGWAIRFVADRSKSPVRLFAWIQILIGLISAAGLPILLKVVASESLRNWIGDMSGQWSFLIFSHFLAALLIMLMPALLIGMTFPLAGKIYIKDLKRTGADVGRIYAVNTVGNVLGALLPSLILLPLLGIQKGIVFIAALNISMGLALLVWRSFHQVWIKAVLLPVGCLGLFVAAVLLPLQIQFPSDRQGPEHRVLFYEEGIAATTKVFIDPETHDKAMSVDGIVIGGTGQTDFKQQVLAHLPKLLLETYENELSVGLGSAILLGESGRHPALKRLVCVEIAPSVIDGASYFEAESYSVLKDPRVSLIQDDITNFLRNGKETFDIISADEKTAENYASNGLSYSIEYYHLLRSRLKDSGLVIQWIPSDVPDYAMVVNTFLSAFPRVSMWYFPPAGKMGSISTFLVGSKSEIAIDFSRIRQRLKESPQSFSGLSKYGLDSAEAILSHYVGRDAALRASFAKARINSLEHPYYEFYSPADFAVPSDERIVKSIDYHLNLWGKSFPVDDVINASAAERQRLAQAFASETTYLRAYAEFLQGMFTPKIFNQFREAIALAPWNNSVRAEVLLHVWNEGGIRFRKGDYRNALAFMAEANRIFPNNGEAHYYLALCLTRNKQIPAAIGELKESLRLKPTLVAARQLLASLYLSRGRVAEGIGELRRILEIAPDRVFALVNYGIYLAEDKKDTQTALVHVARAYRLAPKDPSAIDAYAWIAHLHGDNKLAKRIVANGGDYYRENALCEAHRKTILAL
jgi:spermidine synthase